VPVDRVHFGLYLPPFGPLGDPRSLVDLARRAEAAGWDGFFLWDHVNSDGASPVADPWVVFGAIAAATTRIHFGPMVTPLPRRRPWVVARHAATLSRLSGGRLILGVGLGTDEFGDLSNYAEPVSAAVRSRMLDEALAIMRAIWSGAGGRFDGDHYHVTLPETDPEPYPIPIWVASSAGRPLALRRAAALDGIYPNPSDHDLSPAEVAAIVDQVRAAGRPGDSPLAVAVRGNASHAWPEPQHADLPGLASSGMTWWLESLIHFDPLDMSQRVVDAGPPPVSPPRTA